MYCCWKKYLFPLKLAPLKFGALYAAAYVAYARSRPCVCHRIKIL